MRLVDLSHTVHDGLVTYQGLPPPLFHCLDVAACADALLEASPAWLVRLARAVESSPASLRTLLVQLVALHDIGKLSEKFCRDLDMAVPERTDGNVPSSYRHWEISAQLPDTLDGEVAALIGVSKRRARGALYAAVAGHHGKPPPELQGPLRDTVGVPACRAFVNDLETLDGLSPGSLDLDSRQAKLLSWSLAGLAVAADWIGSDQRHFLAGNRWLIARPVSPPTSPLDRRAVRWRATSWPSRPSPRWRGRDRPASGVPRRRCA